MTGRPGMPSFTVWTQPAAPLQATCRQSGDPRLSRLLNKAPAGARLRRMNPLIAEVKVISRKITAETRAAWGPGGRRCRFSAADG